MKWTASILIVNLAVLNGALAFVVTTAPAVVSSRIQQGVREPCHGSDFRGRRAAGIQLHSNEEHQKDNFKDQPRRNFLANILKAAGAVSVVPLLFTSAAPVAVAAASKDLKEEYRQGTAALAEMDDQAPVPREAYKKLDSGVIYADLRKGSGSEQAGPGSRVNLQWVLRKSNGYFVDSSERNGSVPFIFNVGDGTAIQGLDEAVRGMKVGGVRRVLIPPSLAYAQGLEDGKPGPLPVGFGPRQQMRRVQEVRKDVPGEYVYLEVQLTRMR